jgi:hypothetical protein
MKEQNTKRSHESTKLARRYFGGGGTHSSGIEKTKAFHGAGERRRGYIEIQYLFRVFQFSYFRDGISLLFPAFRLSVFASCVFVRWYQLGSYEL